MAWNNALTSRTGSTLPKTYGSQRSVQSYCGAIGGRKRTSSGLIFGWQRRATGRMSLTRAAPTHCCPWSFAPWLTSCVAGSALVSTGSASWICDDLSHRSRDTSESSVDSDHRTLLCWRPNRGLLTDEWWWNDFNVQICRWQNPLISFMLKRKKYFLIGFLSPLTIKSDVWFWDCALMKKWR